MFHNIKTDDGSQLHSVPMDYKDGDWRDNEAHTTSENCYCSPTKIKSIFSDFDGEVFNHHRIEGK